MRLGVAAVVLPLLLIAGPALAVLDETPPTPTETTTICGGTLVWDPATQRCLAPKETSLDDRALYEAARELAYAGRYDGAEAALSAMSDQGATEVLTYRGFVARKRGDWDRAEAFYAAALAAAPDNFLARSYLGLGRLASGDRAAAAAQLSEIRARGGRNTWAEAALAMALSGAGASGY